VTEIEEKLWLENIHWRQQAHYYRNLHERTLAKQHEQVVQIEVLRAKIAELQKRLFGRKAERAFSSEAWVDDRGCLTAYLEACVQNEGLPPSDLIPWLPWNFRAVAPGPPQPTGRAP
jgi:hypothetical protein